jgi:hypothetical protein
MNWFARYSIPGGYFIVHTFCWLYLINPDILLLLHRKLSPEISIALVGVALLPMGYIITVSQQALYLMIPFMGLIRAARKEVESKTAKKLRNPSNIWGKSVCESELEAHYSFRLVFGLGKNKNDHKLNRLIYFQDWSRKRMDVMAMSLSIIIATIISIFVVFLSFCSGWPNYPIRIELIRLSLCIKSSLTVCLIMFCILFQLRKSIKSALVNILRDKMSKNTKSVQI